jgi:hypothetical protein
MLQWNRQCESVMSLPVNLELLGLGAVIMDLCRRGWRIDQDWLQTATVGSIALALFESKMGSYMGTYAFTVATIVFFFWRERIKKPKDWS